MRKPKSLWHCYILLFFEQLLMEARRESFRIHKGITPIRKAAKVPQLYKLVEVLERERKEAAEFESVL